MIVHMHCRSADRPHERNPRRSRSDSLVGPRGARVVRMGDLTKLALRGAMPEEGKGRLCRICERPMYVEKLSRMKVYRCPKGCTTVQVQHHGSS